LVRAGAELRDVDLPSSAYALTALDAERLPGVRLVRPLLEQQDRAAGAPVAVGDENHLRRLDQRRVLGPVDEAGEVEVVAVRPARGLPGARPQARPPGDRPTAGRR